MRENLEELRKQFTGIVRDEKQASRRLKDIIQKYRAAFQFLSNRSKILEEKLNHLISNRDEAKSDFDSAQMNLRLARVKTKRVSDNIAVLRQRSESLASQYNSLLEGRLPSLMVSDGSQGDMMEKKEHFIKMLNVAFTAIEAKMTETSAEMEKMELLKKRLLEKTEKLADLAKVGETRLALFNGHIKEILFEMNNEDANTRQLMDDYANIEKLMRGVPDVSAWGMKIFRESINAELPAGASILSLSNPAGESASPN
jgi:hypothetical protein